MNFFCQNPNSLREDVSSSYIGQAQFWFTENDTTRDDSDEAQKRIECLVKVSKAWELIGLYVNIFH